MNFSAFNFCRECACKIYFDQFQVQPPALDPIRSFPARLYIRWLADLKRRWKWILVAVSTMVAYVLVLGLHKRFDSLRSFRYDRSLWAFEAVLSSLVSHESAVGEGGMSEQTYYEALIQTFLLGTAVSIFIPQLASDWKRAIAKPEVIIHIFLGLALVVQAVESRLRQGDIRYVRLFRPGALMRAHHFFGIFYIIYIGARGWTAFALAFLVHIALVVPLCKYERWWIQRLIKLDRNYQDIKQVPELKTKEAAIRQA